MKRKAQIQALLVAALPLLAVPAVHATLLVNEEYNYGDGTGTQTYTGADGNTYTGPTYEVVTAGNVTNQSASSIGGPAGPTGNNTAGTVTAGIMPGMGTGLAATDYIGAASNGSGANQANSGVFYAPGLTFSGTAGANTYTLQTSGGSVSVNSSRNVGGTYPIEYLSVPLGSAASGSSASTIYGAYLFSLPTTGVNGDQEMSMDIGAQYANNKAGVDGEAANPGIIDAMAQDYDASNTLYTGGIGTNGSNSTAVPGNGYGETNLTGTYLMLFQLSGLGTGSLTANDWILSGAQYANFESTNSLNAATLNAAAEGTAANDVTESHSATSTGLSSLSGLYLNLWTYEMAANVDEIRVSDASLNEAAPLVAVPEPTSLGILAVASFGLLGRKRHRA